METQSDSKYGSKIVEQMVQKLSFLTHSINNNSIFGGTFYSFLIVLDFMLYGFLIIIGSYPSDEKGDFIDT
eukprot:403374660